MESTSPTKKRYSPPDVCLMKIGYNLNKRGLPLTDPSPRITSTIIRTLQDRADPADIYDPVILAAWAARNGFMRKDAK